MFNLSLSELLKPGSLGNISKLASKVSVLLHCVVEKDQIAVLITRMFFFFFSTR